MGYLEELKERKKELVTELKGIDMILGVYEKTYERQSQPKLRGTSANPNDSKRKLSPGVAETAFDILRNSLYPMSISEIHQELLHRRITCKRNSVSQMIRRHKHHFVKAEDNKWKAMEESPNDISFGDSKHHGEVAEPVEGT